MSMNNQYQNELMEIIQENTNRQERVEEDTEVNRVS